MIVRRLDDLAGTDREVRADGWTSRRLLLAGDRMGFSLHDTLIHPGARLRMRYASHLEAVYCIAGRGTVRVAGTGEVHPLAPGTVYALDAHDEHELVADTELRMVCVFNPPLVGPEVHDGTGAYPLLPPDRSPGAGSPAR